MAAAVQQKSLSSFGRFWQRFRKQRLAILSLLFLIFLSFVAVFRDQLMPFGKDDADFFSTYCKPSFMSNEDVLSCTNPEEHLLGTDNLGRDALSRLIYGARISMVASLLGVSIAIVIGLPLGLLSGFIGGRFDRAVMWVVDIVFSLPGILIAFGVIAVLGNGLLNAMIAVGATLSTRFARLSRGVVLAEREELYVDGARVGGLPMLTIIFKHILPNIAPPLIVQTSLLFGAVILIEAGLSFLGVGVPTSEPSWGRMLAEGRRDLATNPFLSIPPGVAIALTVLAWNIFGDGLRDALGRDITNNQLTTTKKIERQGGSVSAETDPSVQKSSLALRNVEVRFPTPRDVDVTILNNVSYTVNPGRTLGIVGESGSGKSMSVMAAMGIVPSPGQVTKGNIFINGEDITNLSETELQALRGTEIAMIFQEPIASLNPALTVGQQLIQPIQLHLGMSKSAAWQHATELLRKVQVPDPADRMNQYPHQFSGGMAQRVGIARAISCNPTVLIADEPTTALDVTVQGQVIDLLKDLQKDLGIGIVFITHDLGVVAEVADEVAVMYAGEVVEMGSVRDVFTRPQHPYTKALLETLPHAGRTEEGRLPVIDGLVPPPSAWPTGCRFHPRCKFATEACSVDQPLNLVEVGEAGQHTSCIRIDEIELA